MTSNTLEEFLAQPRPVCTSLKAFLEGDRAFTLPDNAMPAPAKVGALGLPTSKQAFPVSLQVFTPI
jgi:hypothetical protein